MDEQRDWLTRDGARVQARQIREFWWIRGYHLVEVRTVDVPSGRHEPITVIRSNIVNGVPPR